MGWKNPHDVVDFNGRVFDLSGESMRYGAWLWWFWLFFFDNPADPGRPRQLMILHSEKNVKRISCNGRQFDFRRGGGKPAEGVVAAWYFDGKEMHHDFLLEKCRFNLSKDRLSTESTPPTSFTVGPKGSNVKIGERFDFNMACDSDHEFLLPTYFRDNILGDFGYSLLRHNRLQLRGMVDGAPVKGTAYVQRVFVNAPVPPWFWGVFHFENGGVLTYYKPHLFGRELRGDIHFFDGEDMHVFLDMDVVRKEGQPPAFAVSGRNGTEKISFDVVPYSHSSWTFNSRPLHLFRTQLVYNEYPAKISGMRMSYGGVESPAIKKLGDSIGNAEHATGILL
jgi:hypothetical protein